MCAGCCASADLAPTRSSSQPAASATSCSQPPTHFHAHNESRAADAPFGFLATATHDTKLGEDTRARINVIAEIPAVWMDHVRQWRQLLRLHRTPTRLGWIPDPHDEYRLYQVLAGTWPFRLMAGADGVVGPAPACENYVHRITIHAEGCARENARRAGSTRIQTTKPA
jgi:(1->4)-alpha-D-glucan 1-alpha-D-glucosylmutase